MLSALPGDQREKFFSGPATGTEDDQTKQAVKAFQRKQALTVDGIAGPITRKALIKSYMALDGTSLPRRNPKTGKGIQLTTHGCGESFPTEIAEPAVDLSATPSDGQHKAEDRRVELFFFGSTITPPPPPSKKSLPGSPEYPAWRRQVQSTIDLGPGLAAAATDIRLQDIPGPQGIPLAFTPWTLQDGDEIIESGETDENGRVNLQTQIDSESNFTLHFPGRELDVQLFQFDPVQTIRGRQARLAFLGYDTGPVDGNDTDRTAAALADFQRDQDLATTGEPDDATNQKLLEIAGS